MCCCRKKKTLEVSFSGRHCTDPICFVLFCLFWFVSIVVLIAAYRTADVAAFLMLIGLTSRLSFGRDYNGDICGSEYSHPGAVSLDCESGICTQIYYPRINEDVSVSVALVRSTRCISFRIHHFRFLVSAFLAVPVLEMSCAPITTQYVW